MTIRRKKSQVTIFLILGVIIVIVVVILVLIRNYSVKKTLERETIDAREIVFEVQPIRNFVSECFSIVSKDSLNEPPDEPPNERPRNIQLKEYVERNIDTCLDFSVFEEQGFEISKKEAEVEVSINENDISFKMTYPIIIGNTLDEGKTEIKDFFVRYKTRFEET
ncbi:MAG: hypothetical protein IH934_06220 [Nanoarchaeota archaeon]|nr:hypothetical protein [Nanoarchaeota archaeon]